jgi:hypothetical protein
MTRLNIKINKISYKLEKKLAKAVIIKGNYRKLTDKQLDKLNNYIKKKKLDINLNDILSIRSAYMTIKIIKDSSKLESSMNKINKLYKKGIKLSWISRKYDLSPILILKNIFNNNFSKDKIKDFFYGKHLDKLNKFELEQLNFAKENDIFNKVDQTEQIKNSENFELEIRNFLLKNKIKFKTQNELAKEQIKKYGKTINTPDFLILSDFYINDKKINWIDAKNFYGANTFLIKKNIQKQIQKYIDEYGFGSIIFSLNFSEKLYFDNVILINFNLLKNCNK